MIHLSALMCPAHRSAVLKRVKAALNAGSPCRLVSTQLVEAGVDIDFPVVYRALAGLDSVVQAAGRCNREGRLNCGRVVVYQAPTEPPRGTPQRAAETTRSLLNEKGSELDPNDPALFDICFRMLYHTGHLDARGIQALCEGFNFATVAKRFRLIEDQFSQTVIVPYGEGLTRLDALHEQGPSRKTLRALQPYTVNIYSRSFEQLVDAGALEEISERLFALAPGFEHLYDDSFGLMDGDEPRANPGSLIV